MTENLLAKPDNEIQNTEYGIRIDGKTQLIGLFGWPLSHTFSPAMHNAAAAAAGLNWVYLPLPVHPDEVETAVSALPALNFRGVNVTVPHKQAVMPFLDEIETGAQAIGAVNTIVVEKTENKKQKTENKKQKTKNEKRKTEDGKRITARLVGYNTDWSGFLADLDEYGVEVAGRDCVILGAGGSARAVAYGLAKKGARVTMLARRVAQAEAVVGRLRPFFPNAAIQAESLTNLAQVVQHQQAPLIVNSTPLGMSPNIDASPWPEELPFPNDTFVYDLIYNPQQTKMMQQALAAGCQAENGLGMLVHQGATSFHLWTGQQPDTKIMRKAIQFQSSTPK